MKGNLYFRNPKLYKKLKAGRTLYKVFICDSLRFNKEKYYGFIDYPAREIFLLKHKNYKETLRHELIHALINELYLKNPSAKLKKLRSNEEFIENLRLLIEQNFLTFSS